MSEKPSEITLQGYAQDHFQTAQEFLSQFEQKVKEGYTLKTEITNVNELASFIGFPRCVMTLAKAQPVDESNEGAAVDDVVVAESEGELGGEGDTIVERIEATSKKKDLLELAKELNIEVPEDKKVPAAIKQFMLNQYK